MRIFYVNYMHFIRVHEDIVIYVYSKNISI